MLSQNILATPLKRKVRKDFIQSKLEPFVFDFLRDGAYTRLDTKQGLVTVNDPRSGEEIVVHRRIWLNVNKKQQHLLFQNLDYYLDFQREYGATAAYSVWRLVLSRVGSFMSKPSLNLALTKRFPV